MAPSGMLITCGACIAQCRLGAVCTAGSSSSRSLGSIVVASQDLEEGGVPGVTPTKKMTSAAVGPSWSQLARVHWPDYVVLFALLVTLVISETIPPVTRRIYHVGPDGATSALETWQYSYPLVADTVPPQAVPIVAFLVPSGFFAAYHLLRRPNRADTHAALLGLFAAVLVNAVATNGIKIMAGRPRPDFMERCWPGGATVKWNADGTPACAATAIRPDEGRKSFPSGHTSWTTTGLGYLSLWVAGKLRAYDTQRGGQPWRIVVSLLPLSLAVYVGLTRIIDYWHHWSDVLAGFLLGCAAAYAFYRQQYPPLCSRAAGEAFEALASGGGGSVHGAGSELELPYAEPLHYGGGGGRQQGSYGDARYGSGDPAAERLNPPGAERGDSLPV